VAVEQDLVGVPARDVDQVHDVLTDGRFAARELDSTDAAVGGGTDGGKTERLRQGLAATPGIGTAAVDYCVFWFERSVSGPSELHDLLLELGGSVDQQVARRIVQSVYGESDGDDAPAPLTIGAPDDGDADGGTGGGEDTLDAIIRAKQAGLIEQDSGVDSADVASAVAEAINPALRQMANAQASLAEGEDGGEIQELREEIEELREARRESELEKLREKVERMEGGADSDTEIKRLEETRRMFEDAPTVSAEAASEWSEVLHSLLDRAEGAARQRAMLGEPGADERQPSYTPAPAPGQGRPGQQAPMRPTQERPAPGPEANGGAAPAGASDGDAGEPADSGAEERAQEIRGKLGISEEI